TITLYSNCLETKEFADGAQSARNVLLLHGAKFSARTWKDLKTLDILGQHGYRVVAINLPRDKRWEPVESVVVFGMVLGMDAGNPAVVVSPSASGGYSIPLLLHKPELFRGFVPVAPGEVEAHNPEDFTSINVPALILYGEFDKHGAERSLGYLAYMPNAKVLMFPHSSHPCYLDIPEMFHSELLSFLLSTLV
ncbi:unnamed protein product, partial [Discosporangium mesarthrocarpum]